jgi:hypothetical protein
MVRELEQKVVDWFEEAELKQENGGLFRRSGALAPKSSLNTHTLRHAYLTSVQSNLVDGKFTFDLRPLSSDSAQLKLKLYRPKKVFFSLGWCGE